MWHLKCWAGRHCAPPDGSCKLAVSPLCDCVHVCKPNNKMAEAKRHVNQGRRERRQWQRTWYNVYCNWVALKMIQCCIIAWYSCITFIIFFVSLWHLAFSFSDSMYFIHVEFFHLLFLRACFCFIDSPESCRIQYGRANRTRKHD